MTNQPISRHELGTQLEELKDVLPGKLDPQWSQLFDELLRAHEFGLALHVLCDYRLEPTTPPAAPAVVKLVEKLHASMQIVDNCVTDLHAERRHEP